MKKIVISVIALMCFFSNTFAQNNNCIEISIDVNKEVTPDEIVISILISEEDYKGKISVQQKENMMIDALKKLKINTSESLTIKHLSSNLKDNTIKKDQIFEARQYMLEVSSAALATQVLEQLNNLDITKVGIARTGVSNKLAEEIKSQLLVEAAKKAKANAQLMAQALGRKAGKVTYITNHYSFSVNDAELPFALAKSSRQSAPATSNPTELKISKQRLYASIQCKFAFGDEE